MASFWQVFHFPLWEWELPGRSAQTTQKQKPILDRPCSLYVFRFRNCYVFLFCQSMWNEQILPQLINICIKIGDHEHQPMFDRPICKKMPWQLNCLSDIRENNGERERSGKSDTQSDYSLGYMVGYTAHLVWLHRCRSSLHCLPTSGKHFCNALMSNILALLLWKLTPP